MRGTVALDLGTRLRLISQEINWNNGFIMLPFPTQKVHDVTGK